MSALSRLFKVGSMAESMGVYLPAMVFQKAVGLLRVVLLVYLLSGAPGEYWLWGTGVMVFTVAAPLLTLGASQGLTRYVSFYEARQRLTEFYRRVRLAVPVLALVLGAAAVLAGMQLADVAFPGLHELPGRWVGELFVAAAVANAVLVTVYHNLLGFLAGLRMYRVVSLLEVAFSVVFTVLAVLTLRAVPNGLAALVSHAAALAAVLACGVLLLHVAVGRRARESAAQPPAGGGSNDETRGILHRVLRYGSAAMLGSFFWLTAQYVSFYLAGRLHGRQRAEEFFAFVQLSQPVLFLANAAWAVIFAHVAKLWETEGRLAAMRVLEASYKAVAMTLMTLTIVVYATSGLWVRVLPARFAGALPVLGGLLMFFQVIAHLAVMTILARLHERPVVIALAALAGASANAFLATWWMPDYELVGAAWAAGIGMFVGAGAVALVYFLLARIRLRASTYFVLTAPALLLAPVWAAAGAWAIVCVLAVTTGVLFSPEQKQLVRRGLGSLAGLLRRAR